MPGFVHVERVRFGDLDAMRHLNNVVFLRYFETARIKYLQHLIPTHDPAHPEYDKFGLIFAECHIAYRRTVGFDASVRVSCTIADVGRSSVRMPFEMHVEDELVADGYGTVVGYDYDKGEPKPLPEDVRERLLEEAAPED
jgi:acyl-CoA thioester hydrolase